MQVLRGLPLQKAPGVAESLDWALALMALQTRELDRDVLDGTLGVLLKYEEDLRHVRETSLPRLLEEAAVAG